MAKETAAADGKPVPDGVTRNPGVSFMTVLKVLFQLVIVVGVLALLLMLPTLLNMLGEGFGYKFDTTFVDYLVVMLLGALVGAIEIISRYQDAPFRTALTWPGMLYMWVNALVAASALWLMRLFGWNFVPGSVAEGSDVERWTQVMTAGLGAMAIFRSSLLVIGKEEEELSIGPAAILQILLNAIDKEVDRYRGQERARTVKQLMDSITYDDASRDLVLISQGLMQNLAEDDIQEIDEAKKKIEVVTPDPEVRKYLLGLKIIDIVGEDVLRQAIDIRGKEYYRGEYTRRFGPARPAEKPVENAEPAAPASAAGLEAVREISPRPKSDAWKADIEALKADIVANTAPAPEMGAASVGQSDDPNSLASKAAG